MKAIIINEDGVYKESNLSKFDFVDIFRLNIRDLRPVFSDLQVATILPRKRALIINFGFIKAILSEKEIYILRHNEKNTLNEFINTLKKCDYRNRKTEFYLFMLEKIFDAKQAQLEGKISKLEVTAEELLPRIQNKIGDGAFKELLHLKKRVSRMEARLNEIYMAVKEVLEGEDDFDELVSFGGGTKKGDIVSNRLEAESILENFIEQIEDSIGDIFRLKEEIEDVEEYVDLKLSSRRTDIVMLDLIATVIALVFSFLAVVVGFFGMNLRNGMEDSLMAFYGVGLFLFFVSIFFFVLIFSFFKKKNIF